MGFLEPSFMKKSKIPKTNDITKILHFVSRNDEFMRNGGGQWVAQNRVYKNKKKYDRKKMKKDLRDLTSNPFYSLLCSHIL